MPIRSVVVTNEATGHARHIMGCLASIKGKRFTFAGLFSNPWYDQNLKHRHTSPNPEFDDINLPWKVFETLAEDVWSLLLITLPGVYEAADARQLIHAAINNGVSHIVLLSSAHGHISVPRGYPLDLGFKTKLDIEVTLKEQVAAHTSHRISWTILKPVAFYETIADGRLGKPFLRSFQRLPSSVQIDFVAMEDVGRAAARVLEDPQLYHGKSVVLAGDKLNFNQMDGFFKLHTGKHLLPPTQQESLGPGSPCMADYFDWLRAGGFRIPPALIRAAQPGMLSFKNWLGRKPCCYLKA